MAICQVSSPRGNQYGLGRRRLTRFICSACIVAIVVYSLIFWWKPKDRLFDRETVSSLRPTMIVALGAARSFATIPAVFAGLKPNLKVVENVFNLINPLWATINPPPSTWRFVVPSIFIAQICGADLGFDPFLFNFLNSIVAGLALLSVPIVTALNLRATCSLAVWWSEPDVTARCHPAYV